MKENGISGIPVVIGGDGRKTRQAGRHSDQPRRSLCHRSGPEGLRADDEGKARHGARRCQPERSKAAAASASPRKASGGRRPIPLRRTCHREGHRKGSRLSERQQGRAGPAACRGRNHGRRQRVRAHREADRCRRRCRRSRYRARPFLARAGGGEPHQAAVERGAGGGGQRGDDRGRAGADRFRRGRDQGRHRPGLDLHDADRRRRRRCRSSPRSWTRWRRRRRPAFR